MIAPVTALYAGLLVLLLLALAGRVSLLRSKLGVGLGHGNDPDAGARHPRPRQRGGVDPADARAVVAEIDGASRTFLHVCGVVFVVSRIGHAVGLSGTSRSSTGRFWGTGGSWVVIVLLALWDLAAFVRTLRLF